MVIQSTMKLLIDTDAFWKLGVAGLLEDAVHAMGVEIQECGRLPALPHMLRKGRLRKLLGPTTSDNLIPLANAVPILIHPSITWLDKLSPIESIDPGEAQILAAA